MAGYGAARGAAGPRRVLRSVLHRYPEKTIRLILVACSVRLGSVPVPQEHQQIAWVSPAEFSSKPLCPADRELLPALGV